MWIPSIFSEEVGMRLLLLPIYLFEDFIVFNDSIQFTLKVAFCTRYIRDLLWILHSITGHHFYVKRSSQDNILHLYCTDQPLYFKFLLNNGKT